MKRIVWSVGMFFTIIICLGVGLFIWGSQRTTSFPIVTSTYISDSTLYDNQLYFGAGYCLYRLELQTSILTEVICTDNLSFRKPVVDDDYIYAAVFEWPAGGGSFLALDKTTGDVIWQKNVDGYDGAFFSIRDHNFLQGDRLYVPYRDGFSVLDKQSGDLLWQSNFNYMEGPFPLCVHADRIYYAIKKGHDEPGNGVIVGVNMKTGEQQMIADLRPAHLFSQVVYVNSEYLVGIERKKDYGEIIAFKNSSPLEIVWKQKIYQTSFSVAQVFSIDEQLIFRKGQQLWAVNLEDGSPEWSIDLRDLHPPEQTSKNNIKILSVSFHIADGSVLYGIDSQSGNLIWDHVFEARLTTPFLIENSVYIGYGDMFAAFNARTGERLWEFPIKSQYEHYEGDLYTQ